MWIPVSQLLVAYLLGSFTARNTDVWLHLGVGRIVAAGDYSFGKDPLSFSGADRHWVNHSWLYDLVSYNTKHNDPYKTAHGHPGWQVQPKIEEPITEADRQNLPDFGYQWKPG